MGAARRRGFFPTARETEDTVLTDLTDAGTSLPKDAELSAEDLLRLVLSSLEDDKAEDVVQIDLREKTEIADYMVVASGRSTRQVSAISEKLLERLKHEAGIVARAEGKDSGDWVLIDAGDVIVHVFRPEVREFYQLEKMWAPGPEAKQRGAVNPAAAYA
jgi:ribosome-associated protein